MSLSITGNLLTGPFLRPDIKEPTEKPLSKTDKELFLHFSYGEVSLSSFKQHYDQTRWLQRKVFALPLAVVGVTKLVFHLGESVTRLVFRLKDSVFFPNNVYISSRHTSFKSAELLKKSIFTCVRDFEEIFGRSVSLVNDATGSFFVHEALHQKKCYELAYRYRARTQVSYFNYSLQNDEAEASTISLFDLKKMDGSTRLQTLKRFRMEPLLSSFEVLGQSLEQRLADADEEMLKLYSVFDLACPRLYASDQGYDWYPFFLSTQELVEISLEEAIKMRPHTRELLLRLEKMPFEVDGAEQPFSTKMLLVDFLHRPTSWIDGQRQNIPDRYFQLLSQKENLNFSVLSKMQLYWFLTGPAWIHEEPVEERKKRFSLVPQQQIDAVIGELYAQDLVCISDDHIKNLAPEVLTKSVVYKLFPSSRDISFSKEVSLLTKMEEQKRRFALFSIDQVSAILGFLSVDQCALLNDEQIKLLEVVSLTKDFLDKLFSESVSREECRRRVSLFSPEKLNAFVSNLSNEQCLLLSDDHIRHLDITILSKEVLFSLFGNPLIDEYEKKESEECNRRFALLSPDRIRVLINKLHPELSGLLSGGQLDQVELKSATQNGFPSGEGESVAMRPDGVRETFSRVETIDEDNEVQNQRVEKQREPEIVLEQDRRRIQEIVLEQERQRILEMFRELKRQQDQAMLFEQARQREQEWKRQERQREEQKRYLLNTQPNYNQIS